MSKEGFENTADRELAEMVPAYGAALEAGRIRPLSVSILQPLTHLAYRDKRMYQQKIAPDQIKPVHELNASPVAARFFDVFIVKDRD